MAESRLDFRRRQGHEHGPHSPPAGELGFSSRGLGPAAAAQSFGAAMAPDSMSFGESEQNGPGIDRISGNSMSVNSSHGGHGHSFSFGGGGAGEELAGEPMSVFLLRGRPGSAGGSNVLPGLRDSRASVRELEGNQAQSDSWKSEIVADALPENYGGESSAYRMPCEAPSGSWSSLGHRRVHSAPNIMAGIEAPPQAGTRWRGDSVPWHAPDVLTRNLRDHAIPEGRRFEALEPPLQPDISPAPGRPRSWRVRTQPPPWGAGPSSKDFAARDQSNLEWMPKLRASYFVDVRSQEGETNSCSSMHGSASSLVSQTSSIGGMAANTRPFEEIKRMRLSQALDKSPKDGTYLGLTPSPTYSASARPNFDTARLTPRFSPGKGIKVGFTPTLNCRPAFGGGGLRDGGFGWQPLSPALTEPPTPPSRLDWKTHESEVPVSQTAAEGGQSHTSVSTESEQDVLPMEQRPLDEVNAVQALMSVGRGTRSQPDQASDGTPSLADEPGAVHMVEAPHTPIPSLDRLKPFDGGDDDDDGLDKDLWVVVEKGSLCASADCVYRDPAARIASRRHYHSKCTHTHNGGVKKGMVFHHHQLEKVQKHQRSHKREATKSAPYKRMTPEDHQAMEGAGVEGYRPEDWDPEETRRLDELVNQLVAPVTHAWPSIARFFPAKSSIQCLLHWRFTLNDNGIIRGNGTWGAEEDERLRKLAPVFSSPATGPRWAKIAEVMPGRTAKQCRERYNNHVDPAIKKDKIWTAEEDAMVMQLHAEHHNQFAKIARRIPGRCYDDVKNRFNLLVKRRQPAGKPANMVLPNSGSSNSTRSSLERTAATERVSPLPPDMAMSHEEGGGLFAASSNVGQSGLTPTSGVKRSTTEMSVD